MPMSNEQFDRRMEFIVEQQAKNTIDIQKLQDAQAELTKKHNDLTEALTTVVGMVGKLAAADDRIDRQLSDLTEKQAETDDRLNILIDVVERSFSGNGRPIKKKLRSLKRIKKSTNGRASKSSRKKH